MLYYFNTKLQYWQAFMPAKVGKSFIIYKKLRKIFTAEAKAGQKGVIMQKTKGEIFQKTGVGALVGIANSVFGGGGGMLAVPLFIQGGMREKQAHATAILVILPISLVSFLFYVFHGFYRADVLVPTALGVTLGGALGAALLGKLPTKTVNFIFALLQLFAGVFLFFFR
jgi:uncharacterized membrane protein YfcA